MFWFAVLAFAIFVVTFLLQKRRFCNQIVCARKNSSEISEIEEEFNKLYGSLPQNNTFRDAIIAEKYGNPFPGSEPQHYLSFKKEIKRFLLLGNAGSVRYRIDIEEKIILRLPGANLEEAMFPTYRENYPEYPDKNEYITVSSKIFQNGIEKSSQELYTAEAETN
jgi:hypothetical protein